MTRLGGELSALSGLEPESGTITVFAVPAVADAAPPVALPEALPVSASIPDVDASAEAELPAPEWAVVRLPTSHAAPVALPPSGQPQGAGAAASIAGGGVWDPFAGAAALRREDAGLAAASPFDLDEAALAELVRRVARSLGAARGSAEFMVHVSPAGRVTDAVPLGGTAPDGAKAALRQALLGERLFRPRDAAPAAQPVRLPSITLG